MQEIINILKNYWPELLAILLFIVSFILQFFKKKPIKVLDGVKQLILSYAPEAIRLAESIYGSGHGEEKFSYAFQVICDVVGRKFGLQPRKVPDLYEDYIRATIENILDTPQKHDNK